MHRDIRRMPDRPVPGFENVPRLYLSPLFHRMFLFGPRAASAAVSSDAPPRRPSWATALLARRVIGTGQRVVLALGGWFLPLASKLWPA